MTHKAGDSTILNGKRVKLTESQADELNTREAESQQKDAAIEQICETQQKIETYRMKAARAEAQAAGDTATVTEIDRQLGEPDRTRR